MIKSKDGRSLAIFTFLGCFFFVSAGCVQNHYIPSPVVFPNSNILGRKVTSQNKILTDQSLKVMVSPVEVRLVIKSGVIDEIQALYDENVEVDQIATAISSDRKNREVTAVHGPRFRAWVNSSNNFEIQLREFSGEKIVLEKDYGPILHDGEKLLIYTRSQRAKKVPKKLGITIDK